MPIKHDSVAGEITDDDIRYVLIRADVLMGVAHELQGVAPADFLVAFGKAAFRNAQGSFVKYRKEGRFLDRDGLAQTCTIAASLGWGRWTLRRPGDGTEVVEVANSPFAAGFGSSPEPVCTPIVGVLKALLVTMRGSAGSVLETACRSQGAPKCSFHIRWHPQG